MSHRPCSAHPRKALPCRPCCPRWDYHRFAVQIVTQGSPSPRWLSVCPSQLCCAGNTMSWDSGVCGDSFSTGLLLEENICINLFLSFLALGLWKKQNSTHHPAAPRLLGWELGAVGPLQMLVPTAEVGTYHLGQACGTQPLSAREWVQHPCHIPLLKMHGLWHYKNEITHFCWRMVSVFCFCG